MTGLAEPRDAERLASLHRACLADSTLSSLGHRALVRYYQFVIGSPRELVLAATEGEVVGGCVLSYAPDNLLSRFARHAPLSLARELVRELAIDATMRRRLRSWWLERARRDGPHLPEITQIFTEERYRGNGIGAQLLRSCEEMLRHAGKSAYTIRTHRDDNDAGIRFYHREGFATLGETRSFGDVFLVMKKDLS